MRKRIFFRADAGPNIGYGHFIRTLALADMLKDDFDCTFFTQVPSQYQINEISKVCKFEILPNDETHFELFLNYLSGDEIVVLDNYYFSSEYQTKIKEKGSILICIDDMHNKHYVADIVINHGLTDKKIFDIENYTQLCLGMEWALLRKPFLESIDYNKKDNRHWLIAFGGSDTYNLTEKFISIIHNNINIDKIYVVIGDAYEHIDSLRKFDKIEIKKNLSAEEISIVMSNCEYAILPSSGICIEALSKGCKILSGYYVDNQVELNHELSKNNYIYQLGDLNLCNNIDISKVLNYKFNNIDCIYNIRNRYIMLFKNIVLKQTTRVNNIDFISYHNINKDKQYEILNNRNSKEITQWMENQDVITPGSHFNFVRNLKDSYNKVYWGIYSNNIFIGSANIYFETTDIVERGIFVAKDLNGKGYGSKIEKATELLLTKINIKTITAKVIKNNISSIIFHKKNGYIETNSNEKYIFFEKHIS